MNLVTNYVSGIIQNSVAGAVDAGMRTAGGYAGDMLGKAGDLIETTGRGFGDGRFLVPCAFFLHMVEIPLFKLGLT
jgi:hypothetical protein